MNNIYLHVKQKVKTRGRRLLHVEVRGLAKVPRLRGTGMASYPQPVRRRPGGATPSQGPVAAAGEELPRPRSGGGRSARLQHAWGSQRHPCSGQWLAERRRAWELFVLSQEGGGEEIFRPVRSSGYTLLGSCEDAVPVEKAQIRQWRLRRPQR